MPSHQNLDLTIRRLNADDLEIFREIRGEAVQRYPQTFGSPVEDQGGDAMLAAYRDWLGGMLIGAIARH